MDSKNFTLDELIKKDKLKNKANRGGRGGRGAGRGGMRGGNVSG